MQANTINQDDRALTVKKRSAPTAFFAIEFSKQHPVLLIFGVFLMSTFGGLAAESPYPPSNYIGFYGSHFDFGRQAVIQ
jgi:hypothetical protein